MGGAPLVTQEVLLPVLRPPPQGPPPLEETQLRPPQGAPLAAQEMLLPLPLGAVVDPLPQEMVLPLPLGAVVDPLPLGPMVVDPLPQEMVLPPLGPMVVVAELPGRAMVVSPQRRHAVVDFGSFTRVSKIEQRNSVLILHLTLKFDS